MENTKQTEMDRMINDRKARQRAEQEGNMKLPKGSPVNAKSMAPAKRQEIEKIVLSDEGSEQYLRARDAIMSFFEELPYHNGAALYEALSMKEGANSPVQKMLRRLNVSKDMQGIEIGTLRRYIEQEIRMSWSHFKSLKARRLQAEKEREEELKEPF